MKRVSRIPGLILVGVVALTAALFVTSARATGVLTSTIQLKISATGTNTAGLGTSDDPIALDWTQNFSSGTGANQASNQFHDRRTLAASTGEDLDLAGGLTNKFGQTLTFTKVKALLVKASSANTNDVVLGNASSNGFISPFGGATHTVKIKPGGFIALSAPDANGYAVTASTADLLHVLNGGAGTSVTYDIVVWGTD